MSEPARQMSYQEYLALEAEESAKHEYAAGVVYAMAGGSPEHARLCLNVAAELRAALRGRPCTVYGSELKIRVEATDRSTYADASVMRGTREASAVDPNALTNPVAIVEVLSPSTEAADRGEKFAHYRQLTSLREYVLVAQDARRVEVFRRGTDDEWILRTYTEGEDARLPSLDVAVSVDAVYADPLGADR